MYDIFIYKTCHFMLYSGVSPIHSLIVFIDECFFVLILQVVPATPKASSSNLRALGSQEMRRMSGGYGRVNSNSSFADVDSAVLRMRRSSSVSTFVIIVVCCFYYICYCFCYHFYRSMHHSSGWVEGSGFCIKKQSYAFIPQSFIISNSYSN